VTLEWKHTPEPPQSVVLLVFVAGMAVGACCAILGEFFAVHMR
jgi:hypothetical protein